MRSPRPPDPVATAQAQGDMNRDTAITQMQLNAGTQVNPWGTITTEQTGETSFVDSQGNTVYTPQFTQTTTLSPSQQAIFDETQAAEGNMAAIAAQQTEMLQGHMSQPFEFGNSDAEQWAYDRASQRILPRQAEQEAALRATLANKGIREGSAAWNAEMGRMSEAFNDQMNQLELTGRGQAFQEALATRNQPINEITALLTGSQVSNPAQMSGAMPQAGVAGVDYAGLVGQNYQAEVAQHNAMMGGLFGMAGAGLGAAGSAGGFGALFSDRRLKRDIRVIGETANGLPWYRFNYVFDDASAPAREGLMSDDVKAVMPEAVIVDPATGFDMVNYNMALGG